MKISAPYVFADQQGLPWDDVDIARPAGCRHAVGEFFERATLALTGAQRHQLDASADVCPDLSHGDHRYIEVKGLRHGNQGIVFAHRLSRDQELIDATGGSLSYCWWTHHCHAASYRSRKALWSDLAANLGDVYVVPFERLSAALRHRKPTLVVERRGETLRGHRVPFGMIKELAGVRRVMWSDAMRVHGIDVPPIRFLGCVGKILPSLTAEERWTALEMLREMRARRLAVSLAPAPRSKHAGHCVRVVIDQNPGWYRSLCASATVGRSAGPRRRRLHDTLISRRCSMAALQRLGAGCVPEWPSDFRVLPYVRCMAKDWGCYE